MDPLELESLFRGAIRYVDANEKTSVFREIEARYGMLNIRLAVMEILWWLEYLYRGGRSTERWSVRHGGPVRALTCLLEEDSVFSKIFCLKNNDLTWNPRVSHDTRLQIVQFVGKNWTRGITV
jgi:hypothetical protein